MRSTPRNANVGGWPLNKAKMSRRKRKDERRAPMPAQSAGLLRFFEEETEGIKIKPEVLMALVVIFIIISVLAHLHASGIL